jgi:hypothetical protein
MPDIAETVPIVHDAPLTEVYATEKGHRHRVYRGDTQEHIDWKLHEYRHRFPELIEVPAGEKGTGAVRPPATS